MTVAIIVQARLGSTRLPAKVLLPLPTGRTVLEEVLGRCKQIPGIDQIICAVPIENCDILASFASRVGDVGTVGWNGPENDVLGRYAFVARTRTVKPDIIMRITSDCPLIDPVMCHGVLAAFLRSDAECAVNDDPMTIPKGLNCEVFSRAALEIADREATSPEDREHVTPFIRRRAKVNGRFVSVTKEGEDMSSKRWTLDTLEDYITIYRILEARGA